MNSHTGRLHLLLILIILISSILISEPVRSKEESDLTDPSEIGVEVFLNDPGLDFDTSVLDELVQKGDATIFSEEEPPSMEEVSLDSSLSNIYLMRHPTDPEMGMVIRWENYTDDLKLGGFDQPMGGFSLSIIAPGQTVFVKSNRTIFSQELNYSGNLDPSLDENIRELGFSDIQISYDSNFINFEIMYGSNRISVHQTKDPEVPENSSNPSAEVEITGSSPEPVVKDKVIELLGLFGGSPTFWENSSRSEFSLEVLMIETSPDYDPDSIDWNGIMRSSLDHLIEIGFIKGMNNDDISKISIMSVKGVLGYGKRIFFYNLSMDWAYYNETDLPQISFVGIGGPSIKSEDLPSAPRSPDNGLDLARSLPIIIIIGVITLFLGSVLYQRINRAVKINNVRRRLIYELVRDTPGIHFTALMRELDLKPGVASYHINRLEKEELIKSHQDGMYRRFFLFDEKVEMRLRLSDLQSLILDTIKDEPGISQIEISRLIGKSKVVINYHVRFLRDLGVLVIEKDGRETHCFVTEQGSRFSSS